MTPRKVNCVLHQIAKLCYKQGRSAQEFQDIVDYSPWILGEEFNEAVGHGADKIPHIIALVWNPTQHCG